MESIKNKNFKLSEFIKLKNISWKLLFGLLNKVHILWRKNHFNNELTLEFQSLSKNIFSKLKSCQENINIRNKNLLLESNINTEFQTLLFDFLYDEQELYSNYDELFEYKKYIPKNKDIPFSSFIINYQSLFKDIYNDEKKIKRLKKLRWYFIFDEDNFLYFSPSTLFSCYNNNEEEYEKKDLKRELNLLNNNYFFGGNNSILYKNDSYDEIEKDNIYQNFINNNESLNIKNDIKEHKEIIITNDIIDNLLDKEDNPLFYIIKLISITITIFCREAMCYMNSLYNENRNVELIKEYIKRFNNFVQASKYINSQCENINIVINYLDKDILENYPHFPKFSIFRFCMKIWYNEMSSILTEDDSSLLFKIKESTLKLFSEYIYEDLSNIYINNSFQSFLFNSGQSSGIFCKSKGDFSLSSSISLYNSNSNSNKQTVSSTICPLGSYYEDSYIKYIIIEKSLSIIYDTFSEEYSVYLFNYSDIETNNYYEDIENNIIDLVENSIKKMFYNNINENFNDNKSLIKKIVDKILNYFNNYFYSQRILNKLKKRIYSTIIYVIKNLIFEQIKIKINELLSKQNKKNNELNNIIEIDLKEKYIKEFKNYYYSEKNHINIKDNEFKAIFNKINNTYNFFEVLADLDKWKEKEMKIIENFDKKVLKELGKNNISSTYNNLQRYLLSFSVKNNWETIRKIRTIENYYQKINKKENKNINNSNSLKQSININSFNDDLNNLNQFNSEDLDDFGNIDYFAGLNNDLNNNNTLNINNNNNSNSGMNNLYSSNIFFG